MLTRDLHMRSDSASRGRIWVADRAPVSKPDSLLRVPSPGADGANHARHSDPLPENLGEVRPTMTRARTTGPIGPTMTRQGYAE